MWVGVPSRELKRRSGMREKPQPSLPVDLKPDGDRATGVRLR